MFVINFLSEKDDIKQVHHLMKSQNFPYVPSDFETAFLFLKKHTVYGVYDKSRMIAAFILGEVQNNGRFLDVICSRSSHGRWASRQVLCEILRRAFQGNVYFIWVEALREASIRAAIQAGFYKVMTEVNEQPYYVMTRERAFDKYFKKEFKNGFCF